MRIRSLALSLLLFAPARVVAQRDAAAPMRAAPPEARQFDFLVGQWELVVRPQASGLAARIHGVPRMVGTWKGWRSLDGWGILDELRITDESGNPRAYAQATRMYDATAGHWTTSTADAARGIFTTSTAEWRDGRMTVSSQGTDAEGKRYTTRSRYYDITPKSFRFSQERSFDGGASWTPTLTIEAKRIAATDPR